MPLVDHNENNNTGKNQMRKLTVLLMMLSATSLSACLDTDLGRAGAGAAAGAVTADVLGGDPLVGAAIGGAAGALCDDAGVCR
jgi:osmotically inducible lipoprotein OsmB